MKITYMSIIGLIAGACTTISFLPQVIKTIRRKETKDISMSMYIMLATGIFLWIVYGVLIGSFPVVLANSASFVLAVCVLVLKIKYG